MHPKDMMSPTLSVIAPETTLAEAEEIMHQLNVEALAVGKADGLLCVITEDDIAMRVAASDSNPKTRTVREIMSSPIASFV